MTEASYLDHLRDTLHEWSSALFDPGSGGFRQNAEIGVNVMSSTDIAWIRYAVDDLDLPPAMREAWVGYLQRQQDPHTGEVRHAPGPAGQGHCDAHAFWQTVRALNILGGSLPHFPEHLRQAATPAGLRAWFARSDWHSCRTSNHHNVLGLVPLLASLGDDEWTAEFMAQLAAQQSPDTGCWPRDKPNISRTFAYSVIHWATGALPPRPDRIVDTMLAMQRPTGLWDGPVAGFHTMDAACLLVRLPRQIDHRQHDSQAALERLADMLPGHLQANHEAFFGNPHRMLSQVHTLGLLQEQFPDRFASRRPWRFDWDNPAVYHCTVIADA